MDKIHFAPPKTPWLKPLFVRMKPGDHIILGFLRWCRISSIHSMLRRSNGHVKPLSSCPLVHAAMELTRQPILQDFFFQESRLLSAPLLKVSFFVV